MVTLSTSCQEGNLSIVAKTRILNEESRRKDKGVLSQSESNVVQHTGRGRNQHGSPQRREKSHAKSKSRCKLTAFIVENMDIFKRTVDTLRRTKVPQRMSNPETFLRRRAHQLLLQVMRRS